MIDDILVRLGPKLKLAIVIITLLVIAGGGFAAYRFYDYTQNNPKFCVSCHLMKEAYDAWASSVHLEINCHDCHHLNVSEMNELMVSFIFKRPEKVPDRHGEVIVPWEFCIRCHWEKEEGYDEAPNIKESKIHAKHYFDEQIECSKCHGYKVHEFVPEERFCLNCHSGIEVHGTGMEELACLNCHTDRTANLRPDRDKCLYCHGGDDARQRLVDEKRVDVRRYPPSDAKVEAAIKINVPKDAPMQFYCYECHKPHAKIRPDWGNCKDCHAAASSAGKHTLHIEQMGMACKDCHKPHEWRVTAKQAKTDCTICHAYKSPESFLK